MPRYRRRHRTAQTDASWCRSLCRIDKVDAAMIKMETTNRPRILVSVEPTPRPASLAHCGGDARESSRTSAPVPSGVALGVVNGVRPGDCRLALRLHRRTEATVRFAARVREIARGEIDAQFVGTIHGPRAFQARD